VRPRSAPAIDSVCRVLDGLRDELDALGFTPFDIQVPGEDSAVAPLEGALRVRRDGSEFVLETIDYGEAFRLLSQKSEAEIKQAVIDYVSRPLPQVRGMSRDELDTIVGRVALHYFDLRDRAREAGPQGVVIDLPPKLPIDRIGALDGVHTYPIDTPFEFRSLPPTALRPENDVHKFLTAADVRVRASITPPWFGRPGGGLRFTLQQPETGLRDLVASGRLQRIQII
jgi:Tuberculosis necrotizing toxin